MLCLSHSTLAPILPLPSPPLTPPPSFHVHGRAVPSIPSLHVGFLLYVSQLTLPQNNRNVTALHKLPKTQGMSEPPADFGSQLWDR